MEHFWFKPKPYHFQKKDHCLRNTYNTKICNLKYRNFTTFYHKNQRGVSGALGIQQPYPLPPNDKMKKVTNTTHTEK